MPQIEIVPMRAGSVADVVKIAEECGLSYWSEADYRTELDRAGSYPFQAESIPGQIVTGFIIARLITKNEVGYPALLEILNIAVKENYRKTGIGTLLIRSTLNVAKQNSPANIRLEVRSSNSAAIEFYKKHGFKLEYVRRNFYSNPVEDGIVMKLDV
jgi:ribosomal-protein-alanine N-acetyltransferase